jgi:hypothetical protein
MKNKKIYGSKSKRTLNYSMSLFYFPETLEISLCEQNTIFQSHQHPKLHPNFFPSKSNSNHQTNEMFSSYPIH